MGSEDLYYEIQFNVVWYLNKDYYLVDPNEKILEKQIVDSGAKSSLLIHPKNNFKFEDIDIDNLIHNGDYIKVHKSKLEKYLLDYGCAYYCIMYPQANIIDTYIFEEWEYGEFTSQILNSFVNPSFRLRHWEDNIS